LFCMDSFSPETLYPMFEKDGIDLAKVTKMNIHKGKFHVYYEEQEEPVKSYTIRSLHKYKSSSCNFCTDLACENADISIGSVGSGPNKNTVFARTGIGTEIMEDAAKKGFLTIEPYNAINLNAVLFLAKLKKVSQYTVQKRKVFIVRDAPDKDVPKVETKPVSGEAKTLMGSRRAMSVSKELNAKDQKLELTLTNTAGFTLDNIHVRIANVDEVFESKPWLTTIRELFPFESIDISYPIDALEGSVLVESSTDTFGKIYSKTLKYAPKK